MKIYVVYNGQRYHELRPLLEDHEVELIRGVWDVFRAFRVQTGQTAVLIESYGRYALLGLLAQFLMGALLILRVRGSILEVNRDRLRHADTRLERARLRLGESILRTCLRTCDAIAYNSKDVRRKLRPYVGKGAKEEVVYIPFTEDRPETSSPPLDLPDGELRLLTVTNMNFEAKVEPTLEAITEWMSGETWERHDIYWVVLGDGRHIERLRREIRSRGLQERVRIPGWVDDPFPYYEWCDVYVHMTRLDGFPNATMEAMSRSRPVLTNTNSCGVREQVIDGKNGYFVSSKDEFESRLEEYAAHPEKRHEHGRNGRHLVETHWTIENQRDRMNRLLNRLSQYGSSQTT